MKSAFCVILEELPGLGGGNSTKGKVPAVLPSPVSVSLSGAGRRSRRGLVPSTASSACLCLTEVENSARAGTSLPLCVCLLLTSI